METLEQLSGEVLRLTYHDEKTSFTVAKLVPKKGEKEIAIIGNMPLIQVGQLIHMKGKWTFDSRHGKQFVVEEFHYELPREKASIERLLSSGFLKGIGPSFAAKIVNHFKEDTFTILDEDPERLREVKGIGEKRKEQAVTAWKNRSQLQELRLVLSSWGITDSMSQKILLKWGNESVKLLKENPYRLAQEIQGIGFQIADQIAKKLGMDPLSVERIDAAISYLLWEYSGEGHTCMPLTMFVEKASERLQAPFTLIEERIQEGCKKETFILFTSLQDNSLKLAAKNFFAQEVVISRELKRLLTSEQSIRSVLVDRAIDWVSNELNMTFAPLQQEAITKTLEEKVIIITGGPGTGKSTITKAIIRVLSKITKKIILAAPTGRAAKRLREITHHYSQTIHRLLKFDPIAHHFVHNKANPLTSDLLIIDEASMVDTFLFYSLLLAVPSSSKVVIIGDVDQLPSIGPGSVLKDLIDSNTIPTVKLNEIFRQARTSKIIQNAHKINKGELPFLKNPPDSDFLFFQEKEPEGIRKKILELVTDEIPKTHHFDPRKDMQLIVPMRRGECGIDQLNKDLQNYFTPTKSTNGPFFKGDKVIQMKNNYDKNVFNGDVGIVDHVSKEEVTILFDEEYVVYQGAELDELSLAWAVSVHKFQGSECPCIIIPIHTQHFKLLNRNLLYTAVTRGKKLVILVGNVQAVAIAVNQVHADSRFTGLKETLTERFLKA